MSSSTALSWQATACCSLSKSVTTAARLGFLSLRTMYTPRKPGERVIIGKVRCCTKARVSCVPGTFSSSRTSTIERPPALARILLPALRHLVRDALARELLAPFGEEVLVAHHPLPGGVRWN